MQQKSVVWFSPRAASVAAALAALTTGLGCYYGHLALGQARVLLARESIDRVLADPETPVELRSRLALVQRARAFAQELGLTVGGQYTSYVPWPGDRMVTSVVATEPGEVEAAGFDFPIVGHVPYKGFFDADAARAEADDLRARGLDVCVSAIDAYSTLGWLDDPLTAPMLRRSNASLVETVIHELVHATVFVKSEPDFNEGAANFIGQEARVRFFAANGGSESGDGGPPAVDVAAAERARVRDDRILAAALVDIRAAVAALYAEALGSDERAARRQALEQAARERLAALPLETLDAQSIAERARLNDACLALQGAYAVDLERHMRVLESLDRSLPAFVARLRAAAEADDPRAMFFSDAGSGRP